MQPALGVGVSLAQHHLARNAPRQLHQSET
jgi:hypothetical protein